MDLLKLAQMAPYFVIASYFSFPPLRVYHSFSVPDFQIINQFASAYYIYGMLDRDFLACLPIGSHTCTDFYIYLLSHASWVLLFVFFFNYYFVIRRSCS